MLSITTELTPCESTTTTTTTSVGANAPPHRKKQQQQQQQPQQQQQQKQYAKAKDVPVTMSSPLLLPRTRPAFEKLLIGPCMVFGEMITGGHYLEVLRIGKQMVVGRQTAPSYWHLHKSFVHESGFMGAFYRGFMPWGLLQCAKGVPVLFIQHESMYFLHATAQWDYNTAEKASGFIGGFAQALFVNPLQKMKLFSVACADINALSPTEALKTVIERHGFFSLYDGVCPMILRRSLDWGIRFGVSNEVRNWILEQKASSRGGDETSSLSSSSSKSLNAYENIFCGLVGGSFSALTHPIDNIVTNCQKPLAAGAKRDVISVVCRMYRQSGYQAFTRGLAINVLDNAYHMAWMYGVGNILYQWLETVLRDTRPMA